MLVTNKERIGQSIEKFSQWDATEGGGVTRLCFSEANLKARKAIQDRMESLGATVTTDDMGNMYARLEGTEPDLPSLVVGSHSDSVIKGGNYDGILGVIAGMEVAETIVENNIKHRHPLTVMVWTNEEGSRFDPALMSSGVLAGKFDKEKMLKSTDTEGITFKEALDASGYKGSEENRLNAEDYKAFVELHIEQGPVLEAEEKDIGVVQGVAGMVNYEFEFQGQSGHAGTVPMPVRKDALRAASQAITYLHENLSTIDPALVYTTGRIECEPNIHTIIPDNVKFTLDARHMDSEAIEKVVEVVNAIPEELADCKVTKHKLWGRETIYFNDTLINLVRESAKEYGYSYKDVPSGAGHDAQYVADMIPTTMVFAPSIGGHSHTEIEYTPLEDCWKAINVVLQTILKLDELDQLEE